MVVLPDYGELRVRSDQATQAWGAFTWTAEAGGRTTDHYGVWCMVRLLQVRPSQAELTLREGRARCRGNASAAMVSWSSSVSVALRDRATPPLSIHIREKTLVTITTRPPPSFPLVFHLNSFMLLTAGHRFTPLKQKARKFDRLHP